ncbi:MAG: DUF3365 domain-containing protein [Planctomycetes bacterium]|nr:DUF3365 domain-containing protein [Planctomycetota bacterium]
MSNPEVNAPNHGRRREAGAWCVWALHERTLLVLLVVFAASVIGILWHLSRLSSDLVESTALAHAAENTKGILGFRGLYSSEVVDRVVEHGIEVSHDYESKKGAIPLPATLSMKLGEHLSKIGAGGQFRLYSDYPYPWRKDGGPHDDFERKALSRLREDPDTPFYEFQERDGTPTLRYAIADQMRASCVACHNSRADSPKKDWKVGDVRGAIEVMLPLDRAEAKTSALLRSTFILLMALSLAGFGGLAYVAVKLRLELNALRLHAAGQDGLHPRAPLHGDTDGRIGETASDTKIAVIALLASAGIFAFSLVAPLGVASGLLYALVVLISLWSPRQSFTFVAAVVGTLLTVVGFMVAKDVGVRLGIVLTNRIMSVFIIWATAILCLWVKRKAAAQARLFAEQEVAAEKNRELRRAHDENQGLMAAIPSILIGLDVERRVTKWNQAAESAFGISGQTALGKPVGALAIAWDGKQLDHCIGVCTSMLRSSCLDDFPFRQRNGAPGFLNLCLTPILDQEGKCTGILLLGTDMSERRNLEAQLVHAQKLESIGQLAAGVAHEINTPIQYTGDNVTFLREAFSDITGVLEKHGELLVHAKNGTVNDKAIAAIEEAMADADLDHLTEEVPVAIEQALEGVDRVAKIVRAMKEFSHPGGDAKAPADINKLIENTITVARNEWKYVADLITDFDPSLPPVPCLAGEFNQVILNLLVNAAHAIAERHGQDSTQIGVITVSTRAAGEHAEIRIQDTGAGIPEAIRSRIFDPFFTTKAVGKGTGQGLAIAHAAIVKKHGGRLRFETQLSKGTTFIIELPLSGCNVVNEAEPGSPSPHAVATASIS